MIPFPSTIARFVDGAGKVVTPFIQYLQQFTITPPDFVDIVVSASPFGYVAKEPGNLFITGGTVSNINLVRGAKILNVTGVTIIPVGIKDTVVIIYSVLPTIKFIPSYGQNTTN